MNKFKDTIYNKDSGQIHACIGYDYQDKVSIYIMFMFFKKNPSNMVAFEFIEDFSLFSFDKNLIVNSLYIYQIKSGKNVKWNEIEKIMLNEKKEIEENCHINVKLILIGTMQNRIHNKLKYVSYENDDDSLKQSILNSLTNLLSIKMHTMKLCHLNAFIWLIKEYCINRRIMNNNKIGSSVYAELKYNLSSEKLLSWKYKDRFFNKDKLLKIIKEKLYEFTDLKKDIYNDIDEILVELKLK